MPGFIEDLLDRYLGPVSFFIVSIVGFVALVTLRRAWTRGRVVVPLLLGLLLLFGWGLFDPEFAHRVGKPDNVPIVMLLFGLGFFLWLAFRKMVINDELTARGEPTFEARESRLRVLCWPDLLYSEFLIAILVTVFLLVWAYFLKAPLEEPGHPNLTPNPAKAPWYFTGLQEMLLYFDPWLAGVVYPGLIITGLMAIPYLDVNPRGNGYYTFEERRFAVSVFLFGFVVMWVLLIVLGTLFRGPNWSFFSPLTPWDIHKAEAQTNINLSEYFYNYLLERPLPESILAREAPGFSFLAFYFGFFPFLLGRTVLRRKRAAMGGLRFGIMTFLLLGMAALPVKMALRWMFHLKYVVSVPEWFFNI